MAFDLNAYMQTEIIALAQTGARFYMKNKNGRQFISRLVPAIKESARIRGNHEQKGLHIPPFLIASIASDCNLRCPGCYAWAGGTCGVCGDVAAGTEMSADEWGSVFDEAQALGISFILLAGGEPLMRRDVINKAIDYWNIVFPVFTNGTLVDEDYYRLFEECRNIIPVLSIEGDNTETDKRRGDGISEKIEAVMARLKGSGVLFGVSVTVTTANIDYVTDMDFVTSIRKKGCGVLFYVEYVSAEEGTEDLVLSKVDLDRLDASISKLRTGSRGMSLISFPGDEKFLGGCLAAGRGFFHINPYGGAEPCPFSPYSKMNLKTDSIADVLASPFFNEIQDIGSREAENRQGGCTLFAHKEEVEVLSTGERHL